MKNDKPLHYVALSFLIAHDADHNDERMTLIERCVDNLIATHSVSKREAEIVTLQAYGEHESRKCRAYVDMSITTSHAIFVRDPQSGRLRVFTVAELMDLVKTPHLSSVPVPSARAMLANGLGESAGPL